VRGYYREHVVEILEMSYLLYLPTNFSTEKENVVDLDPVDITTTKADLAILSKIKQRQYFSANTKLSLHRSAPIY
jgi:hypothetical protein